MSITNWVKEQAATGGDKNKIASYRALKRSEENNAALKASAAAQKQSVAVQKEQVAAQRETNQKLDELNKSTAEMARHTERIASLQEALLGVARDALGVARAQLIQAELQNEYLLEGITLARQDRALRHAAYAIACASLQANKESNLIARFFLLKKNRNDIDAYEVNAGRADSISDKLYIDETVTRLDEMLKRAIEALLPKQRQDVSDFSTVVTELQLARNTERLTQEALSVAQGRHARANQALAGRDLEVADLKKTLRKDAVRALCLCFLVKPVIQYFAKRKQLAAIEAEVGACQAEIGQAAAAVSSTLSELNEITAKIAALEVQREAFLGDFEPEVKVAIEAVASQVAA